MSEQLKKGDLVKLISVPDWLVHDLPVDEQRRGAAHQSRMDGEGEQRAARPQPGLLVPARRALPRRHPDRDREPVKTKTIRHNGREVTVLLPGAKAALEPLHPCVGRWLVNCANGPGCKGHRVHWLVLRPLWEPSA